MTKKFKWLSRSLLSDLDPLLALATSAKEYCKAVRSLTGEAVSKSEWLDEGALGCVTEFEAKDGGGLALVVSLRMVDDIASMTHTLVHESVHVAQRILVRIGEHEPSKEFQAYLVEGAFKNLHEELVRRLDKMGKAEAPIEEHLCARAENAGGVHRKVVYQGRTGSPDRWLMLPGGRLLIVECKADKKKPKRHQLAEMKMLRALGFYVAWVDNKLDAETAVTHRMNDMPMDEFNDVWEL